MTSAEELECAPDLALRRGHVAHRPIGEGECERIAGECLTEHVLRGAESLGARLQFAHRVRAIDLAEGDRAAEVERRGASPALEGVRREQLSHPRAHLALSTGRPPVGEEAPGDDREIVRAALVQEGPRRSPEVLAVGAEPPEGVDAIGSVQSGTLLARHRDVMRRVEVERGGAALRGGSLRRGRADRREHREAARAARRLVHDETRVHESGDRFECVVSDDGGCRVEVESTEKTPSASNAVRASSSRGSMLQSMVRTRVRCRSGRSGPAAGSTSMPRPSRSLSSAGVSRRVRAAASSIASGSPSSARQMARMWVRSPPSKSGPPAAAARSRKSCSAGPTVEASVSSSRIARGWTSKRCSPATPSATRLVASTTAPGAAASSPTSCGAAPSRCSTLSTTRRVGRSPMADATRRSSLPSPTSMTPSAAAIAGITSDGSRLHRAR